MGQPAVVISGLVGVVVAADFSAKERAGCAATANSKEVALVNVVKVEVVNIGKGTTITLISPMGVELVLCRVAEEVDTETVPIRLPRPSQL